MTRESRISDWVQIAASLGVLIGLLLVAFEIRESNRVAKSESIGAMNQAWTDFYLVGAESEISGILEKSFEDPHSLSTEEMMRLVHWFDSVVNLYTWQLRAYELDTAEYDPIPDFAFDAENYFGSPFGRAYLEYVRTWARPELIDAAIAALEKSQPTKIPPNVAFIRNILQQQKEESAPE